MNRPIDKRDVEELLESLNTRTKAYLRRRESAKVLAPEALAEAEALLKRAVPGYPLPITVIYEIAWMRWCRYLAQPGDAGLEDLRAAAEMFARVYPLDPDMVPDALREGFEQREADSRRQQALYEQAVRLVQSDAARTDLRTVDEAIGLLRDAQQAMPQSPDGADVLSSLGGAFHQRFLITHALSDLDTAIRMVRDAVEATPPDHPDRVLYTGNLITALETRFEETGALGDIDEVIRLCHEAGPVDAPDRMARIGEALRMRFDRTGSVADLDASIKVLRESADASPDRTRTQVMNLSALSDALSRRYERFGELGDLNEAIRIGWTVVRATPIHHPDRSGYLSNLCFAQIKRFLHEKQIPDLDDAIMACLAAAETSPPGSADRATALSNLAFAVDVKGKVVRDVAYLDDAIGHLRSALEGVPPHHPDRAARLTGLCHVYVHRYEVTEDLADVEAAILAGSEAMHETSNDHPGRATCLMGLASALHARGAEAHDDRLTAMALYREAALLPMADTVSRLRAAVRWAAMAFRAHDMSEALRGYRLAVELLPVAAYRGLTRAGRERMLAGIPGLARDAGGCSISSRHPHEALAFLEAGRNVLWAQMLDTRMDLILLRRRSPELAAKLEAIRAEEGVPSSWAGADVASGR